MAIDATVPGAAAWQKVIGIVGGLGPHAHIRFEELLLREAELRSPAKVLRDQDYPPYLVAALPGTPDRTEYLLERGPSPLPWLERSLRALAGPPTAGGEGLEADFAVIACNTAHALLPELRRLAILPILDVVGETIDSIRKRPGVRTVGLLATTGALEAGFYQESCAAHGLDTTTLSALPEGDELQRSLVMASIYGDAERPGLKTGAQRQPAHRERLRENLRRAAGLLTEAGADLVIAGCTEIPLVLEPGGVPGVEVVDPLEVAARAALDIATGRRQVELSPVA